MRDVRTAVATIPDVDGGVVRIDSFGESFELERLFLSRGLERARSSRATVIEPEAIDELTEDRGRILAPRQAHEGFLSVLADLEREIREARPRLTLLPSPPSIARLFDKRACAETFERIGVPMASALPPVASIEALRETMRARSLRSAFVKLTCGSSASCMGLYELTSSGEAFFTSMEIDGERLYNSLAPRRYTSARTIARLIGFLLNEGSHVEEAIPKARLDGAWFDCRVVVIAGEPVFTVVRTSRHPVTNLHLGGRRGSLETLEARLRPGALAAAYESAATVFDAFECLHLGVDLLFEKDFASHRIIEANAFGDLLPNATREGKSVYEWEISALADNTGSRRAGTRSRSPSP